MSPFSTVDASAADSATVGSSAFDARIAALNPLLTPAALRAEVPLPSGARRTVLRAREDFVRILQGVDDRLAVVVGPCSVHDTAATLAYARRLADLARQTEDSLLVIMRVYVEKPRTRLGWKGLVNDPGLDGTHDLNEGLRRARELMVQIVRSGLPVGCEFLDPSVTRYLSDAVSWASIGARTVQSQVHRQLASGLNMPIGIKNGTDGSAKDAVDAIVAAAHGHVYPGVTDEGVAAVVTSFGNPDCHVVLRGGNNGPNYGHQHVAGAVDLLEATGLPPRVVIDASHGNSGKDHERQRDVVEDVAVRVADGDTGIAGMMVESFLRPGRQDLVLGRTDHLVPGLSVTDACAGWDQTVRMVERLAEAAAKRSARTTALVA
ncbi:3-deoxy-7-phosphoheptulonate synthase [Streptomyces sp. NPDC020412]|uniref:3-deoxy-7-phosphoheptulonate synthase n=1 Tax=Streptomyces sp. NPDC020412 TaxID=3365073 RepID=UPI0037962339